MTKGCTTTIPGKSTGKTIVLFTLVLLTILNGVNGVPHKRSLLRLCSKNLSDAVYLVCKDRGFNEPFSYSGEDDPQHSVGPGLAEECCYHMCSYAQLEQYCKSDKERDSSSDAVQDSFWIVNLSQPVVPPVTSDERLKSEVEYISDTIKRKIHRLKGGRKTSINDRDVDESCDGKSITESVKKHRDRHCGRRRRRRRQRRRRLGKIPRKALIKSSKALGHPASNTSQVTSDKLPWVL